MGTCVAGILEVMAKPHGPVVEAMTFDMELTTIPQGRWVYPHFTGEETK